MSCCPDTVAADSDWKAREAKRQAEEEATMNREFSVNGVALKIKDMFPDCWAARDFVSKLNLIEKSAGGKELMNTKADSIMYDEPDEEGEVE